MYRRQGVGESRSWFEKCKCNQEKNEPLHFSPIYHYHKARDVCIRMKLLKRQCKFIKIIKYCGFSHTYEIVNRLKSGIPNKGADFIMLLELNSKGKTSNLEPTWSRSRLVAWIHEMITYPFLYHGFQSLRLHHCLWRAKERRIKPSVPHWSR